MADKIWPEEEGWERTHPAATKKEVTPPAKPPQPTNRAITRHWPKELGDTDDEDIPMSSQELEEELREEAEAAAVEMTSSGDGGKSRPQSPCQWKRNERIAIVSAYFAGGGACPPLEIVQVVEYYRREKLPMIIGCDANVHHTIWDSNDINMRGEALQIL
ncbi:GH12448 [Drosophila grimshawi]|uniref:GH12448 n=1 Tax=Drosophila grimshawi TaxID=7222 RepID=B4JJ91_DROGR|nr:GH12448 [Drosophila grimshawi]